MKIFSDTKFREGVYLPEILIPAWGPNAEDGGNEINPNRGRFDQLATSGLVEIVEDPDEADLCVYPANPLASKKNFSQFRKIISDSSTPLAVFYHADDEWPMDLDENVYIFRTSFHRSIRKPREFCLPAWSSDWGQLGYRKWNAQPTVGFLGCMDPKLREIALRCAEADHRLATNFVRQPFFWGGWLSNMTAENGKQIRERFIKNMRESDYVISVRGSGNFSYRLYETLMSGRIPVLVDSDTPLPYDFMLDWKKYFPIVPENEPELIADAIFEFHHTHEHDYDDVQDSMRQLWENWFSPVGYFDHFKAHFQNADPKLGPAAISTSMSDASDVVWSPTKKIKTISNIETVAVIGHFNSQGPVGLKQAACNTVDALRSIGIRPIKYDVPMYNARHKNEPELVKSDHAIIHVQPEPFYDSAFSQANIALQDSTKHIASWYWEIDPVPDTWESIVTRNKVQQIFVPTRFVQDLLDEAKLPCKTRYVQAGLAIESIPTAEQIKVTKKKLGIRDNKFVFLFMFDYKSTIQRKNPLGLIHAFKRAFSKNEDVVLVIKIVRGEELAFGSLPSNVMVIHRQMSRQDTLALLAACDCYVSLHRSEGFGLPLAEAMLLGKPVIATRYSGNLDFMNDQNSLLVDYEKVTSPPIFGYQNITARWAEPSTEHAAELMKKIVSDSELRLKLAIEAPKISELLSLEAYGKRIRDALNS